MVQQIVRFVDSVSATPTIRLDLHDRVTWTTTVDSTSFPPPQLRRVLSETMISDGARIPASAYSNRVLTLSLALTASTGDAQATQLQKLAIELDRPNNVLMWQPDQLSLPIFFRTFRSDITNVIEHISNYRGAEVQILAEPFGYGPKVTLAPVTVNNNPVSSNGLFWDVSSVMGDVETPAVLSMPADQVYDATQRISLFATRRRGTPSGMPLVVQAEACTQGTNTTTQANDATMSGAGNNFSRSTFGTATNVIRLTTPTPTSSTDLRGVYRCWMRYRKSVSGDTIAVQIKWANGTIVNDPVTLPAGTIIRYADLGLVQFPAGPDPVYDGYSNTQQSVAGTYTELWASRIGSGNLDVDYLMFVPADDDTCYVQWSSVNNAAHSAVLDGVSEMAYLLDGSGFVYSLTPSQIVGGGFPTLAPGSTITNRIVFIRDVGTTATAVDAITGSTPVTLSYHPRYLYIRPATT